MANTDSLSDTSVKVNTASLIEACNKWSSDVSGVGLSSIDIASTFSAFTDLGIGTNYFASLKIALERADKLATNISKLIDMSATDQEEADDSSSKKASDNKYGSSQYDRSSGGSSSDSSAASSVADSSAGDYTSDNTDADLGVNPDNDTQESELDTSDENEIVAALESMFSEDEIDIESLDDLTVLKEKLLASPNLSDDLKEKISAMDENELLIELTNILASGELVSDFSKTIITIFDNELKEDFENATIYDSAESIAKVYDFLSKDNNFQEKVREIYLGVADYEYVDDNVVELTRSFVDFLAAAKNVSYEDILTDPSYQSDLLEGINELKDSFSIMTVINNLGDDEISLLYSNIIVGDEA